MKNKKIFIYFSLSFLVPLISPNIDFTLLEIYVDLSFEVIDPKINLVIIMISVVLIIVTLIPLSLSSCVNLVDNCQTCLYYLTTNTYSCTNCVQGVGEYIKWLSMCLTYNLYCQSVCFMFFKRLL